MPNLTVNQAKLESVEYLSSLRNDDSQLSSKLATLTFGKQKYSPVRDMLIILIEYLQIISQTVLLTPSLYNQESTKKSLIFGGVVYVSKLINPAFWLDFPEQKALTKLCFMTFTLFVFLKYLLFCYILVKAKLDAEGNAFLLRMWKLIFCIQGRVICFFITSLFFKLISASFQDHAIIPEIGNICLLVISILAIMLEYGLSFFFEFRFCYVLPSKSFLAQKNNGIQIFTLLQKLVVQTLQIVLTEKSLQILWGFSVLNLLFSIVRDIYYFSTLPLYNIQGLLYQARILMIVTTLDLSVIFGTFIDSIQYESNSFNFIIINWIILSLLLVKLSNEYFRGLIIKIMSGETGSPEFLANKITILKQLLQKTIPDNLPVKHNLTHLLNVTAQVDIKKQVSKLSSNIKEQTSDVYSKDVINNLFLSYIENLLLRFPKNGYLKLYRAYFCHKLQYYGIVMKIIRDLRQSRSAKIQFNTCVLIHKMLNNLGNFIEENNNIDLSQVISCLKKVSELKVKMLKQTEIQIVIYKEILENRPDLQRIFNHAQMVDHCKRNLEKDIKKILGAIPDNYSKPFMLFANYHYLLNHYISEYMEYSKKYWQKYKKYEKYFKLDKLTKENLFQSSNAFIMVSAEKTDAGKILFCSKSIQKIYGNSADSYIGTTLSSLAPPSLQSFYASYFKGLAEKGETSFSRKIVRSFGCNKDGNLIEIDFYADFYLFMAQSFCFNIVLRPVPTTNQCLLLLENGDIECATEKLSCKLSLPVNRSAKNSINIKLLSQDLSLVNQVFNIMALPDKFNLETNEETHTNNLVLTTINSPSAKQQIWEEKYEPKLDAEKVKEIYSIYSNEGASLRLTPLDKKCDIIYHCKVTNIFYGSLLVKIVNLEEKAVKESTNLEKMKNNYVKDSSDEYKDTSGVVSHESIPAEDTQPHRPSSGKYKKKFLLRKKMTHFGFETNPTIQIENSTITEAQHLFPLKTSSLTQGNETPKSIPFKEQVAKPEKAIIPAKNNLQVNRSLEREGSMGTNHLLTINHKKRISSAVRAAIAAESHPKVMKIICLLLYILLIGILGSQIYLKNTLDVSLAYLKTGKDVVSSAEQRNFLLVYIQQNCRFILNLEGNLKSYFSNSTYLSTAAFLSQLSNGLVQLQDTNHDLLDLTNYLDEETRRIIFSKDVKIFDNYFDEPTQKYEMYDNFQGTNRIIETGLKGLGLMKSNITQGKREILFLIRNTVNELLMKNEMTSDILMDSLNSKKNEMSLNLNAFLVILIFFLGISTINFIWVIRSQFGIERSNMLAVVKFNVKHILDNVEKFKMILNNDEKEENMDKLQDEIIRPSRDINQTRKSKLSGTKNKYLRILFRILILIMLLAVSSVLYSVAIKISAEFSQTKQNEFFLIKRMKSQISISQAMSQDLLSENGTTLIHNQSILVGYPKAINDLIEIRNNMLEALINQDVISQSQIQNILFNDGCSFISQSYLVYCQMLKESIKKTGFIYVFGYFQNNFEEIYESFQLSNRSAESLTKLQIQSINTLAIPYLILTEQCDIFSSMVGQILEDNILGAQAERNLYFGMFNTAFVLLSLVIWIFVIHPLQEANNRFKKVLAVFPASMILSNFSLKMFLIKNSKDALNSIKNEI